jgi:hypothetical protein
LEEVFTSRREFRVPLELPETPDNWKRILNARWIIDGFEEAAVYKVIDDEGYTTPITWQWDKRDPRVFWDGFGILNTGMTFKTWGELRAAWPKYIATLRGHCSEAVCKHCQE